MPVGEGRPAKGGSSGAAWGGGGIAQGGVSRTGSSVDGGSTGRMAAASGKIRQFRLHRLSL